MSLVNRGRLIWKLRSRSIQLGLRTLVMGVLNVTPDSFSDGGLFVDRSHAVEHALAMIEAGADIIDVGGESTRPGKHDTPTAEQEIDRIIPVIEEVVRSKPGTIISVDTYKSTTARAAIAVAAEIVNDVSGFLWDERMAATCAQLRCGVVLMHTRGKPDEWKHQPRLAGEEVLPLVKRELGDRLNTALRAGVERDRIVLDPGFGFGKAFENNYQLLSQIDELRHLGRPLLAGVSRKSFLTRTLESLYGESKVPERARETASVAAMVAAILNGVDIVRVHEVGPAVEAARIADAILSGLPGNDRFA
jgi:dihydropteroate synthase